MTEKPAKPAKRAKAAKPSKSADRTSASRELTTRRRKASHEEIAERAYFIHLEEGRGDALVDWLRAERELTTS
jgi:hypothetical protein